VVSICEAVISPEVILSAFSSMIVAIAAAT